VGRDVHTGASLRDLFDGQEAIELERFFSELESLPRLRPVLISLAARAAGARRVDSELQHTAELLHLALLVHDVALGRQGGRRRRVARRIVRRSVGVLGGNGLTLRALELARHTSSPEILGELVETLREFSDGDRLTAALRSDRGLASSTEYLHHADSHTGALLSFCCRAGAHLAGGDVMTLTAMGRYGRHVGRVWNVTDDMAQMVSDRAAWHLVQRVSSGRPVFPAAAAGQEDGEIKVLWKELCDDPNEELANKVVLRILSTGALAHGRTVVAREAWAAQKALAHVDSSEYRSALEGLAAGMAREALRVA
jgi:geranylgeranyl pyrophosphate synthase